MTDAMNNAARWWDVLGLGAVAVDDLLYVDGYPAPDSKTQVAQRRREGGGLAGTALCAAAKLGARAAWLGVLGDDELSRFSLQDLKRFGVDCSPVIIESGARPHYSVILVDRTSGSRTLLAMHDGVRDVPLHHITETLVASCRVLFVDHHNSQAGIKAATIAQRLGIPIVADIERLTGGIEELIPLIDHLIVSLDFARQLTGESEPANIARKLGAGRTCGVVTCGADGCWSSENGAGANFVKAFQVKAVDTTGCGDVFHGAYAACLAQRQGIDVALRTASAMAALKAMQPGGRAGIPERAGLDEFLRHAIGE